VNQDEANSLGLPFSGNLRYHRRVHEGLGTIGIKAAGHGLGGAAVCSLFSFPNGPVLKAFENLSQPAIHLGFLEGIWIGNWSTALLSFGFRYHGRSWSAGPSCESPSSRFSCLTSDFEFVVSSYRP